MNETNASKIKQSKNKWIAIGIIFTILVVALVFMSYQTADEEIQSKTKFSSPSLHGDTEKVVMEKAQREIKALNEKNLQLKNNLDAEINNQLLRQVEFEKRLNQLETDKTLYQEIKSNNSSSIDNPKEAIETDTSLQEVMLNLKKRNDNAGRPKKNVDNYVPSGTFVKAVMIGGSDASAAVFSEALKSPMLFRIIEDGTLPNHKKSHLKDCMVTGAVFGDISSERGLIRTEQLSCVLPNGQIIDVKVRGTIFGPEGKNGVKGTPVWRENALLQRAFAAGALSGLAEGVTATYSTQAISPQGVVSAVDKGKVFQSSGAKGIGKAMEKLADYNIQRAEQYHPVIQLSAGTVVDIVFMDGFFLDESSDAHENDSNAAPTLFKSDNKNPWGFEEQKYYDELRNS